MLLRKRTTRRLCGFTVLLLLALGTSTALYITERLARNKKDSEISRLKVKLGELETDMKEKDREIIRLRSSYDENIPDEREQERTSLKHEKETLEKQIEAIWGSLRTNGNIQQVIVDAAIWSGSVDILKSEESYLKETTLLRGMSIHYERLCRLCTAIEKGKINQLEVVKYLLSITPRRKGNQFDLYKKARTDGLQKVATFVFQSGDQNAVALFLGIYGELILSLDYEKTAHGIFYDVIMSPDFPDEVKMEIKKFEVEKMSRENHEKFFERNYAELKVLALKQPNMAKFYVDNILTDWKELIQFAKKEDNPNINLLLKEYYAKALDDYDQEEKEKESGSPKGS